MTSSVYPEPKNATFNRDKECGNGRVQSFRPLQTAPHVAGVVHAGANHDFGLPWRPNLTTQDDLALISSLHAVVFAIEEEKFKPDALVFQSHNHTRNLTIGIEDFRDRRA
jgi:hypothetical protein